MVMCDGLDDRSRKSPDAELQTPCMAWTALTQKREVGGLFRVSQLLTCRQQRAPAG
jgi:hypothetical protein